MSSQSLWQGATEDDVLRGLRAPVKQLPCRLFYDARGAELFERICTLPEYYLTRSETALLRKLVPSFAKSVGPRARVVEPGSGSGIKTRLLLDALERPSVYVPIDVSREQLDATSRALRAAYPELEVAPLADDYTCVLRLPRAGSFERTVVFFPGSTIGNFEPAEARAFLHRFGEMAGPRSLLLLGADSNHDAASLEAAYDDAEGVTAAFNLNALRHVNRTYGARFDLAAFEHRAVWNAAASRVEMHLVSRVHQSVSVGDVSVTFEAGEPIVTEHCYKHSPAALRALLAGAGWRVRDVLADAHGRMHLWCAEQ